MVTFSVAAPTDSPQSNPLAAKRLRLSEKIDSLDLIKQHQKRLGQTITEIEQQQDILRDSLNFYRARLESTPKTVSGPSLNRSVAKFFKKPVNFFDWIIIITGIIALFSGLMLVIGVTRAFSRKRRPKHRSPELKRQTATQTTVEKPVAPAPAYPNISTDPSPGYSTAIPMSPDMGVTQLQRRIEKYQTSPGAYDAPQIPELPPLPPQSNKEVTDTAPIEARIIDASRNGLDIGAISRKFQISSDHVALILKMAGQRPPTH